MSVTEFTIDRAKWGKHMLLDENGKMCCLGFLSLACGVPSDELLFTTHPEHKWPVNNEFKRDEFGHSTELGRILAGINDGNNYSLSDKEDRITNIFADNGIKVTFIGETL
jgi:hypothetical protein